MCGVKTLYKNCRRHDVGMNIRELIYIPFFSDYTYLVREEPKKSDKKKEKSQNSILIQNESFLNREISTWVCLLLSLMKIKTFCAFWKHLMRIN